MVPLMDRAKLAQLKRLKKEMRRIMAETGVEGGDDDVDRAAVAEAEGKDELAQDEGDPVEDVSQEVAALEDGEGDPEDELTRMKREYFKPKPRAQRPGTGLVVAVEHEAKKQPPSQKRSMRF